MMERVLLLNRFPYWLYADPKFFLEGVEDLCILHAAGHNLDFPSTTYSSAVVCDFNNEQMTDDAIDFLYQNQRFNRVVNLTEPFMQMAARIRDRYNLPGMDAHTATLFRNKVEMKKALQAAGIAVPRCSTLTSVEDVHAFVKEFGKSIIKPVDGMGTFKTYVLDSPSAITDVLHEIEDLAKYEIEQFITGEMFHADSVIVDGEIKLCSISRYLNSTLDFAKSGYLASVMIDDSDVKDRIYEFNQQVIEAFNYRNGVTHHELFVSNGELVFCEIGARAGGAGVIPSIMAAYGINLFEADVKLQLNREIRFPKPENKSAGWLVIHNKEGIVVDISKPEDFDFDWISYKDIKAKRGDLLGKADMSVASVADFTITGHSEADVVRKMEFIRNEFKLVTK